MTILDPDRKIVDAHHHLWPTGHPLAYPEAAYLKDLNAGHNVEAAVFVECGACYRSEGDPAFSPVGETEYVAGARRSTRATGGAVIGAGIVGFVDFTLPSATVGRVLAAHIEAGEGAFRGVRRRDQATAPARRYPSSEASFRAAFAELAPVGLSFDAWLFFDQLPELADLAAWSEETPIVVDHFGAPIAPSGTVEEREAVFSVWRANVIELARRPNVYMKLGGLGMPIFGFGFEAARGGPPADAETLAHAWRPYVDVCVEAFGTGRCMFESNFPVDRVTADYVTVWNAFKLLTQGAGEDEKAAVFSGTARRFYRLDSK